MIFQSGAESPPAAFTHLVESDWSRSPLPLAMSKVAVIPAKQKTSVQVSPHLVRCTGGSAPPACLYFQVAVCKIKFCFCPLHWWHSETVRRCALSAPVAVAHSTIQVVLSLLKSVCPPRASTIYTSARFPSIKNGSCWLPVMMVTSSILNTAHIARHSPRQVKSGRLPGTHLLTVGLIGNGVACILGKGA